MSTSRTQVSDAHKSRHHAPSLSWQAISFAAVGASGTVVTFGLLTLLHKVLGWRVELANIPAYGAGIVNNYVWNRMWTFRHVERRNVLHQGSQFVVISLVGMAINTAVLSFCIHHGINYVMAFGIAAAFTYGWNFYLNHRVTFRHHIHTPHLPG